MPNYQVQINGQNFVVEMNGRVAKHGFFTVRVVEASDPAAAETAAVQRVRETEHLRKLVRNGPDDPPIMEVTEMVELDPEVPTKDLETGFAWYEDPPKRWWQFWRR